MTFLYNFPLFRLFWGHEQNIKKIYILAVVLCTKKKHFANFLEISHNFFKMKALPRIAEVAVFLELNS